MERIHVEPPPSLYVLSFSVSMTMEFPRQPAAVQGIPENKTDIADSRGRRRN